MTESKKSEPLAAEFLPATRNDWRKLVDAMLKGAPFERLESRTHDGLTIEPLYERAPAARAIAGRAPGAAWIVIQRVDHPDPAAANAQALEDLKNGASGLTLVFAGSVSAHGFGIDASPAALARVLDNIPLDAGVTVDLSLSQATGKAPRTVAALVKNRGFSPSSVNLLAGLNPIGGFASTGRRPLPWSELSRMFASLVGELAAAGFRGPFAVADGRVVHNAGGSQAQELAFVLATAIAYLRALEQSGMPLEAARDAIYFRLAADADQFLTLAKFRAARKLWARVEAACGLAAKPVTIAAETAWRMMTKRAPYVNMVRTAIAVAAAGFGGADAIATLPHTAALGLPDALARRIARNTQLVFLEEASLARVGDPGAGSGAIETITQKLCASAWLLFRDIEKAGGIWAALETGTIQDSVAAVRAEREVAIARRTEVLTGTNDFPDVRETKLSILDVAPVSLAAAGDSSRISAKPLRPVRLAEPFERLREQSDGFLATSGARPKVFLACLGTPAAFSSRATFAKNFFEVGGIEAVSGKGDGGFGASGATLACLCASDKTYDGAAAAAAAALKAAGARHIYLAGRPGAREAALRTAGVQSFIHEGGDALATLRAAYDILGIEQQATK